MPVPCDHNLLNDNSDAEAYMERQPDPEDEGVGIALDKICSLESRLRQAIQSTHTLNRSFGRDMGAVDREREALLLVRENLELLEDKLREYRTMAMDPKETDDKAIALSQLDSLRKDLLRGAKDRVDYVLFNKDVVKDIIAFADTGAGDESLPDLPPDPEAFSTRNGYSEAQSPCSSDAEEGFYGNDDSRDVAEHRGYINGSRVASPYASKESLSLLMPDKEDTFPHPAPASTPGIRATSSQATREYYRPPDIGSDSMPNMHTSSVDQFRTARPLATSHSPGSNASKYPRQNKRSNTTRSLPFRDGKHEDEDSLRVSGYGKNASRGSQIGSQIGHVQHEDENGHDIIQPRSFKRPQKPPSCVSSSDTPLHQELSENVSLNYKQPPYGGKLSFGRRDQSSMSGPVVPLPPTPVATDPPRNTRASSFSSDDQTRAMSVSSQAPSSVTEIEPSRPNTSEQLIQPSRLSTISIRNKMAADRPQLNSSHGLRQGLRRRTGRLLGRFAILGDLTKGAFSGVVGLAAVYTIFQAVGKSGLALQLPALSGRKRDKTRRGPSLEALWKPPSIPRLYSRSPSTEQLGRPRADGHLVPEWMHNTKFSATDQPPIGLLTPSTQPPAGEMFPVVPPPHSKHVKC